MELLEKPKTPLLNPGQQLAHDTLTDYIMKRNLQHPWWLLKGYAGTGKTFTISQVIRSVLNEAAFRNVLSPRIVMSAPTHKAVKVLRKSGTKDVDYATIHSLYGLKPEVDEYGVQKFKQSRDPSQLLIEEYDVLIIDEVSMLNLELFEYVRDSMKHDGLRVIFMGDPVQIPPVCTDKSTPAESRGDSEALAHAEKHNIGVLELTQVVRQAADNPILSYATELRRIYQTGIAHPQHFAKVSEDETVGLKVLTDDDEITGVLTRFFRTPEFEADADYMKVIAWTNKSVNIMNSRIRRIIYGERTTDEFIITGEKLVMDAPYILNRVTNETLKTNDELVVMDVSVSNVVVQSDVWVSEFDGVRTNTRKKRHQFSIPCYMLRIAYEDVDFNVRSANIPVVHPGLGIKAYNDALEVLKRSATVNAPPVASDRKEAWNAFYKFKESFAAVKYNYAITAHKSQGSTYANAMSIEGDMSQNRKLEERNRIKYVAATRAKNLLYIVK